MLLRPSRKVLFSQTDWSVDCLPRMETQLWLQNSLQYLYMFFNTWAVSASIQGYLVLAVSNTKLHCRRTSQQGWNTSSLSIAKFLHLRKQEEPQTQGQDWQNIWSAFSLLFQNLRQVTLVYKFDFFLLQNIKIIPSLLQYKVFYKLEDNCISVSHTGYQK